MRRCDSLKTRRLTFPSFETRAEIARHVARARIACALAARSDGAPLYPGTARVMCGGRTRGPASRRASPMPSASTWPRPSEWAGRLRWRETGAGPAARPVTVAADPAAWGDVILGRKDTPTSYHLSVVIDDALQGVTHVVRGQDLFWSTSVHRLLQALLGLAAPAYHHHRLMLDADGRKLSKSHASNRPARTARPGHDTRRYPPARRACQVGLASSGESHAMAS